MTPDQVISLMEMGGPTFAMGDHADHVHVGYAAYGSSSGSPLPAPEVLKPEQWERLIDRIAEIDNPEVADSPSKYSVPAGKDEKRGGPASPAHKGE